MGFGLQGWDLGFEVKIEVKIWVLKWERGGVTKEGFRSGGQGLGLRLEFGA